LQRQRIFFVMFVPSGRRESPDGFLIPSNKGELNLQNLLRSQIISVSLCCHIVKFRPI
jgi:hypothetical protein